MKEIHEESEREREAGVKAGLPWAKCLDLLTTGGYEHMEYEYIDAIECAKR
jgi:hypothetical protein